MKTFKDLVNEVAQPLSQGEKNFKDLHGSVEAVNRNMVPGITDQDHIFKGMPRREDPRTASYEDQGQSEAQYDKTLKTANESVEDIEEEYKDPDKHYAKQSKKMQDAINLHLRKGKTYWDSVRAAKVHVKEEVDLSEADKDPYKDFKDAMAKGNEKAKKKYKGWKPPFPVQDKSKVLRYSSDLKKPVKEGWVALGPATKPGEKPKSPFNKLGGLEPGSKVYGDMPKAKATGRMHKGATDISSMRKEEVSLDEKMLTPAEKAKREEIVKAMKRKGAAKDARTYAIATATAKRVAEETGHIDEVLDSTISKLVYGAKAQRSLDKANKAMADHRTGPKEYGDASRTRDNRNVGLRRVIDKVNKEEVENIDELSKKTLGSYIKGATQDIRDKSYESGVEREKGRGGSSIYHGDFIRNAIGLQNKAGKRQQGIKTAVNKITQEEVENLDEISNKVKGSYIQKASMSMADAAGRMGYATAKGNEGDMAKFHATGKKTFVKRMKGIIRASNSLKKETAELEEAYKDPDAHYEKLSPQQKDAVNRHLRQGKSYWEAVRIVNKIHKEETAQAKKVAEEIEAVDEGIVKNIKRGLQGWSGNIDLPITGTANKPKDVVKRAKDMDEPTARKIMSVQGKTTPHSPADLQMKVLKKRFPANEEVELDEARRGRPRKDGTKPEGDEEGGREHIIMQLRKVVNLRGQKHVEFNDNSKHEVGVEHAKKALAKHDSMHRASDKQAYAERLAKSHASFKSAVTEAVDPSTMRSDRGDVKPMVRRDAEGKLTVHKRQTPSKELKIDAKMNEALKGDQHKIDANKNGKVDAHDFKLLKHRKKMLESVKANMAQDSVDKIKKDPLASKEKIVLPPTQGNKPVGGEDQVHTGKFSVAEETALNSLYESLSDKNKAKFEEKMQTEEGIAELLEFALEQGF